MAAMTTMVLWCQGVLAMSRVDRACTQKVGDLMVASLAAAVRRSRRTLNLIYMHCLAGHARISKGRDALMKIDLQFQDVAAMGHAGPVVSAPIPRQGRNVSHALMEHL